MIRLSKRYIIGEICRKCRDLLSLHGIFDVARPCAKYNIREKGRQKSNQQPRKGEKPHKFVRKGEKLECVQNERSFRGHSRKQESEGIWPQLHPFILYLSSPLSTLSFIPSLSVFIPSQYISQQSLCLSWEKLEEVTKTRIFQCKYPLSGLFCNRHSNSKF